MGSDTAAAWLTERRSYGRLPLRVFVSIQCGGSADHTGGFCRDISKGGIYLFTDVHLQQGSEVEVCIAQSPEVCDAGKPVVAQGRVTRSERYMDGRKGAAVEISRWVRLTHACDGRGDDDR